ncbi:MAG: alpha/beta hydrolase [Polyangiales bacterium]
MDWHNERAPTWFRDAVARPTRSHFAEVSGARIHYLSWNHDAHDKPALFFMHGFRGHARWWSFVAPYFCEQYRVYALDFSGMGESEGRASYDPLVFALDIAAVVRHAGIERATMVGHSFGGNRLLRMCAEHPELVERAVVIDSYVRFLDDPEGPRVTARPRKLYPRYDEAKARYRLTPPENAAADYLLDYIAHHSIEQAEGGFRWRFADNLELASFEPDGAALLRRVHVPVTYVYGALSRIGHALPRKIVQHIAGARGPIAVPEAHHHVMLDQPLALVALLRALLLG